MTLQWWWWFTNYNLGSNRPHVLLRPGLSQGGSVHLQAVGLLQKERGVGPPQGDLSRPEYLNTINININHNKLD